VGITAAWLSHKLKIPLVGSWHTNLHEYAASRLSRVLRFLPGRPVNYFTAFIERKILRGSLLYYKIPKIILAPNSELIKLLRRETGREVRLMSRGVDTNLFSPEKRKINDGIFHFGFVGRLRPEKNVRLLAEIEKELLADGKSNFKFLIVGEGSERFWLEENLSHADFTGFLEGESLAEAYSNMDALIFPSETDAFGNVIQEANAAGVPAIVSKKGGPKFIVQHDKTGFIVEDFAGFVRFASLLLDNPQKLATMKAAAREFALSRNWDAVFENVYAAYAAAVSLNLEKKPASKMHDRKTNS
jgi:glycosyltransferase involved in cell wall biosynthesis